MLALWKSVPDYPGYEVSDQGEVRSVPATGSRRQGKVLKAALTHGYRSVDLYNHGGKQPTRRKVSVILLEAFVGPRPEGMHACHRDDVRDHDTLDNLYWGTPEQNVADAYINGKRVLSDSCGKGHPFTEKNTYVRKDTGMRMCRQCMLETNRRVKGQTPRVGGLYGGKGASYVG